jgi:hypothetical protein
VTIDHVAPAEVAASCPSFKPASMSAYIIKNYEYDAVLGRATMNLAIIGADDVAVPVDPAVRYFLGDSSSTRDMASSDLPPQAFAADSRPRCASR